MAGSEPCDVSIGKFDILATYTYANGLFDGLDDGEARERGMVAAVMGAKARLGHTGRTHHDDCIADKQAAEKKKRRPSPPSRSTSRSPTRWEGSSTSLSCPR
jgi:hypothetical protein